MKGEFLLEIGSEEIPASFMVPAMKSAVDLMSKALDTVRLEHGKIETYATPRRLIIRIQDLADHQTSTEIEKTGPTKAAAYDEKGAPTKAARGFAKSQGVDVSDLVLIMTPKGEQVGFRKAESGRPTIEVLAEILPDFFERLPFPKTMRWMGLDARFARPIHWIIALYNGAVIPFSFGSIQTGAFSYGHRFTHPQKFEVSDFASLAATLKDQGVIIDADKRKQIIMDKVRNVAAEKGYGVFDDIALLDEVTFLVESPYPLMGTFSDDFLELPASILITCMKKHQRYFSVQDSEGRITNKFIAINNTPVKDPEISIKGHQRVLKARLEDARFYFREDRKTPLIDSLASLKGVVFHSKLGTAYEKVERFTNLAVKLAEKLAPEKIEQLKRAALLSKCDLETGIVYEFPELQGIIGSYYARKDGESEEIATAIREHYLPAFAGDRLPEGIIGSLVSIADRMDTIAGCFSVGLIPTGTADPYALRRNVLGVIQILINLDKPLSLRWLIKEAVDQIGDKRSLPPDTVAADVLEFIQTRFVNFHTSRDFPLDVVEAAVRARFDDISDARRRVEALTLWKNRPDFDSLMVGFKRVMNILKGVAPGNLDIRLLSEEAEKGLYEAFIRVVEPADLLIAKGDYGAALEKTAELKQPIDSFFDNVMVMVEDEKLKRNRLALLSQIAGFLKCIADFSFIGSTAN